LIIQPEYFTEKLQRLALRQKFS